MTSTHPAPERGFTLIEMAVVIAVIALILGSLVVPLVTQVEERRIAEARRLLDDARESLVGFALVNARLPCPASSTSGGIESPVGGGACTNPHDGFLPAATLGITPTDAQGFAVDPWGNRIRYSVTTASANAFTTANAINTLFMSASPSLGPDLQVCSTGVGVAGAPPSCAAGTALTTSAPAVVFSTGANGATGGTSADEAQNPNPNGGSVDRVFVSRAPGTTDASGGEFDDIVTWLSPHVLYSRLAAAGRLP